MIISENHKNLSKEFEKILKKADLDLKSSLRSKEEYFLKRAPDEFEEDVRDALVDAAKNTQFENTIHLISKHAFPDISINKFYGVEVKTTKQSHWRSTGNSVFETTRIPDVEDIYIYFGKLSSPVGFKFRKYEDCLYDIAVTHSPRYLIDMNTTAENNIFSKLGYEYNVLRQLPNPVKPFTDYYKKNLKPGESPWWIDPSEDVVPPIVRMFSLLKPSEKKQLKLEAMILFPELFGVKSSTKYLRVSVWMAVQHGILNSSLRDIFSAGGQCTILIDSESYHDVPQVFKSFWDSRKEFFNILKNYPIKLLRYYWDEESLSEDEKIRHWAELFWAHAEKNSKISKKFLVHLIAKTLPQEYKDIVKEECRYYDIKT